MIETMKWKRNSIPEVRVSVSEYDFKAFSLFNLYKWPLLSAEYEVQASLILWKTFKVGLAVQTTKLAKSPCSVSLHSFLGQNVHTVKVWWLLRRETTLLNVI